MLVFLVAPRVFRAPRGELAVRAAWCARGRRPARSPSAPRASLGASSRSPARPRHRPRAPQPGPPDPPAPSTPVGPGVLMRIHIIAEPTPNFARNSHTAASSFELGSLELQRFPTLLKLLPIELRATFRGQTPNTRRPPHLKPITPMRADHCHEMKPPTPLRSPHRTRLKPLTPLLAQNSQFQAVFRPQRCHGFHAPLAKHPQRRRRFHQTLNQGC